jgi:hypothetical protein
MAEVSDYFRVVSIEGNILHIELKGFWSDEVIEQFGPAIQKGFRKAVLSLKGKRFILVADWSGSPVFGSRAEEHLAESMTIFKQHNGYKVVEIVPKALVRIGLKKAAAQTGEDDFRIVVKNLAKARKVVEELKQDL